MALITDSDEIECQLIMCPFSRYALLLNFGGENVEMLFFSALALKALEQITIYDSF